MGIESLSIKKSDKRKRRRYARREAKRMREVMKTITFNPEWPWKFASESCDTTITYRI